MQKHRTSSKEMAPSTCPVFWLDDPSVIWKNATDFFPFHRGAQTCSTTALNSLTRFGIYLGILLMLLTQRFAYICLALGIPLLAIAAYKGMEVRGNVRHGEGFQGTGFPPQYPTMPESRLVVGSDVVDEYVEDVIGTKGRTLPTAANPFMNVLLTEIGDTPQRPPAKNSAFLKRQFSNQFQDRVYGDPNDVFQKTQNQRIWAVQPITSIPNDQESFQNWLFRTPGRTCKEGNGAACKSGTDGSQFPYLSQA